MGKCYEKAHVAFDSSKFLFSARGKNGYIPCHFSRLSSRHQGNPVLTAWVPLTDISASQLTRTGVNQFARTPWWLHRLPSQAAQSNGLFSHVGRALGISTNGAAPSISHLAVAPVDARVDAAQLSLTTNDTLRVACRVLYTVQRLDDEAHYKREPFEPGYLTTQAGRNASVIDLPQVGRAPEEEEGDQNALVHVLTGIFRLCLQSVNLDRY